MGRRRDQAHVASRLAAGGVEAPDGQQPGQLPLGAGVGLEGHGVVAGDLGQPRLQRRHQLSVALGLGQGHEGVELAELRPGDRRHLRGGVELHGAAPQRDHRSVESHVLVGQGAQVAEHLRLRPMGREHRVGEVLGLTPQGLGESGSGRCREGHPQGVGQPNQDRLVGGLVEGDADGVRVDRPQVDAVLQRCSQQLGTSPGSAQGDGVEEGAVHHLETCASSPGGHTAGPRVDRFGDVPQALGAVVHRVHGGHHGQQDLGCADVRGGLLATDVLLTGLQSQAVRWPTGGVHRDAHQAAGHGAP